MKNDANEKLRVFSPSRTETWDSCHLKVELREWVPKVFAKRDLARYAGAAWAEGMAVLNRGKLEGTTHPPALIAQTVLGAFTASVGILREAGVQIEQQDIDDTCAMLLKTTEKYMADDPLVLARGWTVHDVELQLPEHGKSRIDWGGHDPYNVLCQVDYKLKINLEQRWYDKTVAEYQHSWQMQHYCWAYGDYRGEHVSRYYICLVVMGPRYRCTLHQYEIDPELTQAWHASALQKWADMAAQANKERVPDMAASHRTPFGDCEYKRACLEYKLDEDLMQQHYVKLPKHDGR